jgi:hypothetical protein
VPAVFAAVGGAHFLPYGWLHRTRLYIVLGLVISLGSFLLTILLREAAFPFVALFWSVALWAAALVLWQTVVRPQKAAEKRADQAAGAKP